MESFYDLLGRVRAYEEAGEYVRAVAVGEKMWQRLPDRRGSTWYHIAVLHARRGKAEAVADILRRALDAGALWRLSVFQFPELAAVRDHPAVRALIGEAQRRIDARGLRPLVLVAQPAARGPAPLLLHLRGAFGSASMEFPAMQKATELGWIVAAAQSSQPSGEDRFCWDPPRERILMDLRMIKDQLPAHTDIVLSGFSQGAWIALSSALTADIFPASGLILLAPFVGRLVDLPLSTNRIPVAILVGDQDLVTKDPSALSAELRARGHAVTVEIVPGLGHEFAPDFGERLPRLLRAVASAK